MTSIWLVRHGEAAATWGEHPDPGLSERGRAQAELACQLLISQLPEDIQIISSPKARALETAKPLAEHLDLPIHVDDAYQEIQSPVPLEERQAWLTQFMSQGWAAQPASIWAWRKSIVAGLESLQTPTVIFCHFLVINAALAHLRGNGKTVHAWPANGSIHKFEAGPEGLFEVSLGEQIETRVT